jgi:hypothetical protein
MMDSPSLTGPVDKGGDQRGGEFGAAAGGRERPPIRL